MAYDAILNGAKALTFFGGNNVRLLQRQRRHVRLELDFWQSVLEPLVTAALGLQPDRARARECREGSARHHRRLGHRDDGEARDVRRRPVADRGPQRRRHEDGDVQGPAALGASGQRLHREPLDHRFGRILQRPLRPVGRPRLPLRRAAHPAEGGAQPERRSALTSRCRARVSPRRRASASAASRPASRSSSDSKLVATVPPKAKSGPIVVTSALKQVQTKAGSAIVPQRDDEARGSPGSRASATG